MDRLGALAEIRRESLREPVRQGVSQPDPARRIAHALELDVDRGDVVVLRYPRNPDVDFVKRVVAVPGDRVEMRAGVLFVNGEAADDYGSIQDLASMDELTVPCDAFFVLGDNRPVSCDSREFGLVAQDLIKGRVRARFWPLETASVF